MTRTQIAFDLDTRALSLYYPTEHWREAYRIIKKYVSKRFSMASRVSIRIREAHELLSCHEGTKISHSFLSMDQFVYAGLQSISYRETV